MSSATKEALKELGRNVVLLVVSFLLTAGVLENLLGLFGKSLSPEVITGIIAFLTFGLRAIDKYIHESPMKAGGLLPF